MQGVSTLPAAARCPPAVPRRLADAGGAGTATPRAGLLVGAAEAARRGLAAAVAARAGARRGRRLQDGERRTRPLRTPHALVLMIAAATAALAVAGSCFRQPHACAPVGGRVFVASSASRLPTPATRTASAGAAAGGQRGACVCVPRERCPACARLLLARRPQVLRAVGSVALRPSPTVSCARAPLATAAGAAGGLPMRAPQPLFTHNRCLVCLVPLAAAAGAAAGGQRGACVCVPRERCPACARLSLARRPQMLQAVGSVACAVPRCLS